MTVYGVRVARSTAIDAGVIALSSRTPTSNASSAGPCRRARRAARDIQRTARSDTTARGSARSCGHVANRLRSCECRGRPCRPRLPEPTRRSAAHQASQHAGTSVPTDGWPPLPLNKATARTRSPMRFRDPNDLRSRCRDVTDGVSRLGRLLGDELRSLCAIFRNVLRLPCPGRPGVAGGTQKLVDDRS